MNKTTTANGQCDGPCCRPSKGKRPWTGPRVIELMCNIMIVLLAIFVVFVLAAALFNPQVLFGIEPAAGLELTVPQTLESVPVGTL